MGSMIPDFSRYLKDESGTNEIMTHATKLGFTMEKRRAFCYLRVYGSVAAAISAFQSDLESERALVSVFEDNGTPGYVVAGWITPELPTRRDKSDTDIDHEVAYRGLDSDPDRDIDLK